MVFKLETNHWINIVTSRSSDPEVTFVSRMFAPAIKLPEDPACGSANCLLAPYWAQKLELADSEMFARQVSARGGEVRVKWHESTSSITLSGQAKVYLKGELNV